MGIFGIRLNTQVHYTCENMQTNVFSTGYGQYLTKYMGKCRQGDRKNCKIQKNPTMNAKNPDPGGFFGCIAILLACFWGYSVFRGQFDNLVVDYS